MFGNTNNLPSEQQQPMGVQAYKASTNEQARPVPYLCGKQRFALTFISDIFDQRVVAVTQTVGKQSQTTGYNYYASFAALACIGPVDALHDIFLNGDSVYAGTVAIAAASLTHVGATATFHSTNAHGLTTGQSVLINGAEQLEYNGTFPITVTGANSFTYAISGNPVSPATTPNSQSYITARVHLAPVVRGVAHPDSVAITIPNFGVMRLYWGTETQTRDAYLNSGPFQHPAYRGICYAVFEQLFLGFNQTNVQNIEVVLARYPEQSWLTAQNINDDSSLVPFVADMLQNPRCGLGLTDDQFDTAALLASAATLEAEGLGFSPLVSREQEITQLLASALEYVDGYPVFNEDGTMGLKLVRPPAVAPVEIVDADLIEKPSFTPEDWTAAYNETYVKFTNRWLEYKEDQVGRPDTGVRSITGWPNQQTLDRAWVTDPDVANALRLAASRSAALPPLTGKLKLHKDAALFAALAPGEPFTLNYSRRNTSNLIFRVDQRSVQDPAKPEFEITFHADRSYVYES
jgi:hypothetical protein